MNLNMEIRSVDLSEGILEGICVPYDETSYLTADGRGERVMRGAFRKTIRERGRNLKLFREHDYKRGAVGLATAIDDKHPDGLYATFKLGQGDRYADVRDELEQGLLTDLSIGFRAVTERRGQDGAREVTEAKLSEVSLVTLGAYDGARVLAMRGADQYPHAPPALPIPEWMLK